ncbi:MAG TPA: phosphotransferase family protein [Actinomycetota bacterium]|jgi:aminoglycoside phosphotransferase (APT) family kinase protein
MTDGVDPVPGLDVEQLRAYLDRERPGLVRGPLQASVIPGGRSNLSYDVGAGASEWVLRRPPLGHVLATAHDMAREYRVITALAGVIPVPRMVLLCEDESVLGAPFYLMERVEGTVYRTAAQTAALSAEEKRALACSLIDVLADLHAVDPAAVGLADFGRPQGFLERQVRRWARQLEQSRSREVAGIDRLRKILASSVPASSEAALVHGDYRLDNVLADDVQRIVAVLDWEMATLGDPRTDLGLFLLYWDGLGAMDNPVLGGVGAAAGFPAGVELVRRYEGRRGVDVGPLDWYLAFACFKLAVIAEGIWFRFTRGQTVGGGFEAFGDLVEPLVRRGLDVMERPDP